MGVGGAYGDGAADIGDIAVASAENYGDIGVRTAAGWQSSELIGIPLLSDGNAEVFNRFCLDPDRVRQASDVLAATGRAPVVGPFVTVQECSGTTALGEERRERFGAVCENMEGAAAAHISRIYSVPFLELRAMSNRVEDRDTDSWDVPLAASVAQKAAVHLLERIEL